jgi:hypothetical protein
MVLLAVSLELRRGVQQQSMRCDTKWCWENFCEMSYVLNLICCGSNGAANAHTTDFHANFQDNVSKQTRFSFWRHHPTRSLLILQDVATSFGATSKAKYTNHALSILMKQNSQLRSEFKGSPWKSFHRDCKSVLNDMVVNYTTSLSNSNDKHECSHIYQC